MKRPTEATVGPEFRGWSDSACPGTGRCRLTIDGDTKLTARFAALSDPQQLSVDVTGRGSVVSRPAAIVCRPACDGDYPRGRTVVLAAKRVSGWTFAGWSGACSRFGRRTRCEVRMDGAQAVAARFERRPAGGGDDVRLIVDPTGAGSGRVTGPAGLDCTSRCRRTFPAGTRKVKLRAAEGGDSEFAGWGDACAGTAATCDVALTGRTTTVRPRFDLTPAARGLLRVDFNVDDHGEVSSEPEGLICREECRRPFRRGEEVLLTADADDGWRFAGWTESTCSEAKTCRVTVGELTQVTANFEREAQPPPPPPPPTTTDTTTTPITRYTLKTRAEQHPTAYEMRASADTAPKRRNCSRGCSYVEGSVIEVTVVSEFPVQRWANCESFTTKTCRLTLTGDRTVTADFGISG